MWAEGSESLRAGLTTKLGIDSARLSFLERLHRIHLCLQFPTGIMVERDRRDFFSFLLFERNAGKMKELRLDIHLNGYVYNRTLSVILTVILPDSVNFFKSSNERK